jgi:hypothetical protein
MKMTNANRFKDCIELCWECRTTCLDTLFNYCFEKSGPHAAVDHVKIMSDCIETCQLSADLMRRKSEWHGTVCRACADICEACADSCRSMEDDRMQSCAAICSRCADSCRSMADMASFQREDLSEPRGMI